MNHSPNTVNMSKLRGMTGHVQCAGASAPERDGCAIRAVGIVAPIGAASREIR